MHGGAKGEVRGAKGDVQSAMCEPFFPHTLHLALRPSHIALCTSHFALLKNSPIFAAAIGGIAQLARALAWHARGHRFESDYLHVINPGTFGNQMFRDFSFVDFLATCRPHFGITVF